VVNLRCFSKNY